MKKKKILKKQRRPSNGNESEKRSGFLPKRGRARVWAGRLKRRLHTVPLRLRKKGDVLMKINNDLRRYYLLRGLEKKRMKNETITKVRST